MVIKQLSKNIIYISFAAEDHQKSTLGLDLYAVCCETLIEALDREDIIGVVFNIDTLKEIDVTNYKLLFKNDQSELNSKIDRISSYVKRILLHKKPIVSILSGKISGLAFSLAMLSSYRILVGNKSSIGFIESKIGLYPGFGVIFRLCTQNDVETQLKILTQGQLYKSQDAILLGLINEIAESCAEALNLAKKAISTNTKSTGFSTTNKKFSEAESSLLKTSKIRANGIPNILATIEALENNPKKSIEDSLKTDAENIKFILNDNQTIAMVRTLSYGVLIAKEKSKNAEKTVDYYPQKIAIIGAGMMGAGIAYSAAMAGLDVSLIDITIDAARRGKAYSEKTTSKAVQLGLISDETRLDALDRITPLHSIDKLSNLDLIIEAINEEKELKINILSHCQNFLSPDGILATNTTSIPISELATAVSFPESLVGLHFFSPVDRMPLLEIIRGKKTSNQTQSKALKIAQILNKIPIVVNDGPAFYTSRIFFNYILEGIVMVLEGVKPQLIEDSAKAAGFNVGPLAVLDEISLSLMTDVYDQLPKMHESQRKVYDYLKELIGQGRDSRRNGKGFYDYPEGNQSKTIWSDLSISQLSAQPPMHHTANRLLNVVALDAYRCLDSEILDNPLDGDIGSILGIGYPKQTGGVFSRIDQVGLQSFVTVCQKYSHHGPQWEVPQSLVERAEKNQPFYKDFITS